MASNLTATLSPYDVTVVISKGDFQHIITGYAEDQMIGVEPNAARFELYTGGDNSNTRIHKNNTSAVVTLFLQQSSSSNDILQLLLNNDLATRDSTWLFTFTIKDNSGRSLYNAQEAYLANVPSANHGTSMNLREWQIHTPKLTTYIGGNARLDSADQDSINKLGGVIDPRWIV